MDIHDFVVRKVRVLNEANPALGGILIRGTIAAIEVGTWGNVNRLADQLIQVHRLHGSGVVCAEEKHQDAESVPQETSPVLNGHGAPSSTRPLGWEPASTQRSGSSL